MTALAEQVFTYQQLKVFAKRVFEAMGCPAADARKAGEVLLSADLRGVDSHGVVRLSGYVRLWKAGRVHPSPQIKVVHETPSTATIDGDAGLGLVVVPKAMELAVEKALQCGSGWVSVCNSNHFGIAGYHAMLALIPGDPEREMEMQRIKEGIPLLSAVVEDLQKLSKEFSIEL
jgi:LDH2 family malate/lactate/ureidoglycolate dehydrogenase